MFADVLSRFYIARNGSQIGRHSGGLSLTLPGCCLWAFCPLLWVGVSGYTQTTSRNKLFLIVKSCSNPGLEVLRYWDGVGTGRRGEASEESGRKCRADGRLPRCGTSWLRWVPAWAGERLPRPEVQVATRFRGSRTLTAWPQLRDVARPKAGEDARALPTLSLPLCRRRPTARR